MSKFQVHIQKDTAHRVIAGISSDLEELSLDSVDGIVAVKVENINRMAAALRIALVSLVGT